MKICTKCNEELDIINFSPLKRGGHKPRCKKCQLQYYYDNRDAMLLSAKQYRIENIDELRSKSRVRSKLWGKTEQGKLSKANYNHKRRQLIKFNDNSVTQEALDDMLLHQNGLCNTCKVNIEHRSERHLDHIHPLSKGGLHTISNLQWLCVSCNLYKSNKLI